MMAVNILAACILTVAAAAWIAFGFGAAMLALICAVAGVWLACARFTQ